MADNLFYASELEYELKNQIESLKSSPRLQKVSSPQTVMMHIIKILK